MTKPIIVLDDCYDLRYAVSLMDEQPSKMFLFGTESTGSFKVEAPLNKVNVRALLKQLSSRKTTEIRLFPQAILLMETERARLMVFEEIVKIAEFHGFEIPEFNA